jgi:GDPmannose 4,6-dehydratase
MRALITGVAGQDGTLLSNALLAKNWDVTGTMLPSEVLHPTCLLPRTSALTLDVTDNADVYRTIATVNPDVIFHFAAITSVTFSIKEPALTTKVNIGGTKNILKVLNDDQYKGIHLIHAASTEIYDPGAGLITESSQLLPRSPYAESKSEAYRLCVEARERGVKASNAVLSNHESYLRSSEYVTGKIAEGVAKISLGLDQKISLGNLDVRKDWSSARDIVDGLIAIAEQTFVGDVILASGKSTTLTEFIEAAFDSVGIKQWQRYISINQDLVRIGESKGIQIDPSKARDILGWKTSTPLKTWVSEMVDFKLSELINN